MENSLFLGVPILKHIRVKNYNSKLYHFAYTAPTPNAATNTNPWSSVIALPVHLYRQTNNGRDTSSFKGVPIHFKMSDTLYPKVRNPFNLY